MHLNINLFRQPKQFWVLAFGEIWNTFSYYGTQTILALYFIHVFHFTRSESYLLYGAYAAFAYSLPLLGGIVADRWLGSRNTLFLGAALNIGGNLLLMSFGHYWFCLGLATSLVGSGLYKSTSTHLVGTLYPEGDIKKEAAFTWLYLAVNVGGTLGPLAYGFAAYSLGWNFGFLFSALGILISLLWFLYNWNNNEISKPLSATGKIFLYVIILASCLFFSIPFYIPKIINPLIFIMFIVGIIYLLSMITRYTLEERRHLWVLLLIGFFGMFYFAAGLQIGTTITLFIQDAIQKGLIKTQLPASTFSTLYPLFVLLLAPFFTYLWHRLKTKGITPSAPAKLALGMILATIGISAFACASLTKFIILGIIIGNLMLSAGELVLTPAVYTAVSNLSPPGMKNTMMGCWLLFIALGSYLSSVLASAAQQITRITFFSQPAHFGEFVFIAVFTLSVVLVLSLLTPRLSKMML